MFKKYTRTGILNIESTITNSIQLASLVIDCSPNEP